MAQYGTLYIEMAQQWHTLDSLKQRSPQTRCNTKINRVRARTYLFTLNNYTEEDIKHLVKEANQQEYEYIFQEEIGENGTPHLQGYIRWKNPKDFDTMKKLIPKAHLEVAINANAVKAYVTKTETRNGDIYTNIEKYSIAKDGTVAQVAQQISRRQLLDQEIEKWENEKKKELDLYLDIDEVFQMI